MALIRDVIYKAGPSLAQLIKNQRDLINLKPVNKITIRFDPFREDVKDIRDFNYQITCNETVQTNPKCLIKTEILSDRSEQTVTFDLINGKQIIFKCAQLKCLEMLQLMNKHITPLAPAEEISAPVVPLEKKKGKKK